MSRSLLALDEGSRLLLDNATEGIALIQDGMMKSVNPGLLKLTSYSEHELTSRPFIDFVHPDDRQMVAERHLVRLTGGEVPSAYSFRIVDKQGTSRWVEVNALPILWHGAAAVLCFLSDVTERRTAEEALKNSEQRYRLLTEKMNDVIWTTDPNLRMTYISPSLEKMLGFTPEERLGQTPEAQMTPESLARVQELLLGQLELEREHKGDPERTLKIDLEYYHKDGSTVWAENLITGIRDTNGALIGIHGVARDISERRRAQEALKASEERFRTLIEKSTDAIAILDATGKLLYESPSMERITGYKLEDWLGKAVDDWLLHPGDMAAMVSLLEKLLSHPEVASEDVSVRFKHKDGSWHFLEGTVRNLLGDPKVNGLVINYRDVTERRRAEEAVRESEEKFRTLFDSAGDAIFIHEPTGQFLEINQIACQRLGYTREELLRMTPRDLDSPEYAALVADRIGQIVRDGQAVFETAHQTKDGRVIPIEASSRMVDFAGRPAVLTIARDITERVNAAQALKDSEERFRALIEEATDAVAILDASGKTLYCSPSMRRVTGYGPEEWAGKSLGDLLIHPDDLVSLASLLEEMKQPNATAEGIKVRYVHKDGSWHTLEATVRNMLHDPKIAGIVANFRDITERKQAEDSLRKSEERFRGLVETSSDWVWENDRNSRYTYVSPKVRDILGYEPQELLGRTPYEFMHQREGRRVSKIVRRLADAHLPFSLLENTCTHKDGHLVVLETSAVPIIDNDGSFLGYRGIDRDITERKKVEQELQRSLKRLEKTMESTVEAITTTIETRDPYTTGHQMRVTDLACAIARVMELPPTQIEGIRVAGLLHDIGKIAIPTEILSKPGKLTKVEFSMIQTHVKVGYNILKKIEFAWPVARAVLQHHERWNGSGYPNGIRGEDILLEARILAVADVMEAMASDRPYRPSVGLDQALDEITKNSGILYDPAVAKACVTAFTQAGFRFASSVPGVVADSGSRSSDRPVQAPEDR